MSLILRKDKCNNDNKAPNETTTPIHTMLTTFSQANYYTKITTSPD